MNNFIEIGDDITVKATSATFAGVPLLINQMVVIPKSSAAIGQNFAAMTRGGFILKKTAAVDIKQLEAAYFDAGAGEVTNVKTANLMGYFLDDAAAGTETANVMLTGQVQAGVAKSKP